MKVIYVGGTCDFCEYLVANYPPFVLDETVLVKGRHYTVVERWPYTFGPVSGFGVRVAEYPLPENWGHCSCGFREIDGDAAAWNRIMKKNRPKTKELEPA